MSQATSNRESIAAVPPTERAAPGVAADLATLTKPGITVMVVVTGLSGLALGRAIGDWSLAIALGTAAGTALSCMGACALNQLSERYTDAKMRRTADRPLPAGRLSPATALAWGTALAVAGVATLLATTNPLAAAISAATTLTYVFLYTPLKKRSPTAVFVGAFPGAAPPLIGYAAGAGAVGTAGLLLFAILLVWQIPHFLAIAWLYREDYARAGLPVYAVHDPSGATSFRLMVGGCALLLAVCALPTALGVSGALYLGVAIAASGGFLALAVALQRAPTRVRAKRLFFASLIHLPVVYAFLLIDAA